ncbi:MAG: trigger factor [Nevskia sp.]|nr:trigger factor [Nevskia sp.]
MEVHVESAGGLARRLQVTIPAERVERELGERLKRIAGRVKLPGFRPGKVPMKVVVQQYGDSARMELIGELVRQTWPEALTQAQVQPAAAPNFEVTGEKAGEPLVYVASFDVLPEVTLDKLDQLQIMRPVVEITEADIDRLVENLRKARRTVEKVERAAQAGDVVVVDFEGKLDGAPFQGGEGKKVEIEIGLKQFLPDLEDALIGHSAGDSFTTDVSFPADYRAEQLKGKTAQFEVTVDEVREPRLPEIDDDFLKGHGVEEGAGIDGLRNKCRTALEAERDKATRARLKREVLDQLLNLHPIEVPKSQVDQEVIRLREEAANRMGLNQAKTKLKPEQAASMLPDVLFEANAQRRVALGLLMAQAIKVKNIKLDNDKLEATLNTIAADYDEPEQVKMYYRSRPEMLDGLRAIVVEEQVVEALLADANSSDQQMSLEDLLKSQAQPAA